ncbi:ParB/RepB/Spo0J family partition protein [Staphylococcus hyicus]|nr:ParB/RepB/Spo0J family partition protein [Staphylococcus hyicus]AJC97083.1 chromosome partitioning protein ParB [Staphylococcus hyicus]MCO4329632.1 ParB/RepB/Spo0J family partition protein [Staphylococcus hyicus]MCO4337386.1 ParB/RepB/Spo0J family partition protein [Staphylococcus hyicus]MCQ9291678.1 ParB/RepB/Spo0J family partition protein [Staphylococcus hyicus]MCQ9300879.1 ParB/RepB/Spo0J family partition protein [Staphylococcus hyicus]
MADLHNKQHSENVVQLNLTEIRPNPYQPRQHFDQEKLDELSKSIQQHGILQPIVVTPSINGYYIVAGERRFRASQRAQLHTIPAIVKEMDDTRMRELAIIENLQREDLNPLEEAESYQQLMEALSLTQQQVAQRLGKSRPYIANMLRLLQLPVKIRTLIREGKLSGGHGRTLLALKETALMQQYAQKVINESWSVRTLEAKIAEIQTNSKKKTTGSLKTSKKAKPSLIKQHEQQLSVQYGTKVDVSTSGTTGKITLEFYSEQDYRRLLHLLKKENS